MNKKQIKLAESDLKQIVKESVNKILNEAYGTTDRRTQNLVNNLRDKEDARRLDGFPNNLKADPAHDVDNARVAINRFIVNIQEVLYKLTLCTAFEGERNKRSWTTNIYSADSYENIRNDFSSGTDTQKYLDAIEKQIKRAVNIAERLKKVLIMNQGVQPDSNYFDKYNFDKNTGGYNDSYERAQEMRDPWGGY